MKPTPSSRPGPFRFPGSTLIAAVLALALLGAAPPLPATPAPAGTILLARPFTLDQSFTFGWSADHPEVTHGWILVLEVEPQLIRPRETQEPILFVGPFVAQQINGNFATGRVVVIVPGDVDFQNDLVWFGSSGLPEQTGPKQVLAERNKAVAAGIRPFPRSAVTAARDKGGEPAQFASKLELLNAAARLVREYASAERGTR